MPRSVIFRGRVVPGQRVSCQFTELSWVKEQFRQRLQIEAFPGTFNLEIFDADLNKLASLRRQPGIEIVPKGPAYCVGKAFQALVEGRISAAVLLPDVADYPKNKLELVSAGSLREALSVRDGDVVRVEVFLAPRPPSPAAD